MKEIVKFLYEVGMLKRKKHEGYALAGVPYLEMPSIAEHSFRTAVIGYVLARLESYEDPYKVVAMCVFHDIEETRIPDINKVANRATLYDSIREGCLKSNWMIDWVK